MTERDPHDGSAPESDVDVSSGSAPEEVDTTDDDGTPIENPSG